jgi:preprotein translocase subunit SecB
MTEDKGGNGANQPAGAGDAASRQQRAQPPLVIQAQYVKDLSFEAPATPQIFPQLQQAKPDIHVNCDVQARPFGDGGHEVVLHLRADCKVGDAMAFVVELSYGGLFRLNVPAEHVNPVLMIECPRLLFPFARQILASATLDGGFLPLMLGPIDFASLYQRQMQDQQARDRPKDDGLDDAADIKLA